MIIEHKRGDVFLSGLKHIVAGIPKGASNRGWGMGSQFVRRGWANLTKLEGELGETLSFENGDVTFHGIICYQWGEGGWKEAASIVGKALDELSKKIGSDEVIALVPPGFNEGQSYGAKWEDIKVYC